MFRRIIAPRPTRLKPTIFRANRITTHTPARRALLTLTRRQSLRSINGVWSELSCNAVKSALGEISCIETASLFNGMHWRQSCKIPYSADNSLPVRPLHSLTLLDNASERYVYHVDNTDH